MSKRAFKSKASSSRAAAVGGAAGFGGFGSAATASTLSYLTEPPNLALISDPNVVVSFKNLLKKDSATKKRGLEELRGFISSQASGESTGIEEPILEAWVQLYPRIAIDNDRSVRELSHDVQSQLVQSLQKKIMKYLPRLVGPWLAGMSDRDRGVARMAQTGIRALLDTEDKYKAFLKRCQTQVLDYVRSARDETPETLSDERNTSPDEMLAKYQRVLLSSNWLLLNLLSNLDQETINSCQEQYDELLSDNPNLWLLVTSEDSNIRISTCELLTLCLEKLRSIIEKDLDTIMPAFINKGLRNSQDRSAKRLLDTLIQLEKSFPQSSTWTSSKSISSLKKFVEKGSQAGGPEYWQSLQSLIDLIPRSSLTSSINTAAEFLSSFRAGINRRDEVKNNHSAAWSSYIHVAKVLHDSLNSDESVVQGQLYSQALYPIFEGYLHPSGDNLQWSTVDCSNAAKAFYICAQQTGLDSTDTPIIFGEKWKGINAEIIVRLRSTLPEQSKDYRKSQDAMAVEIQRYFDMLRQVMSLSQSSPAKLDEKIIAGLVFDPMLDLLKNSGDVLVNREGKPYSAASPFKELLKGLVLPSTQDSKVCLAILHQPSLTLVKSFLQQHYPALAFSAASPILADCLNMLFLSSAADETWKLCLQSIFKGPVNYDSQWRALTGLLYGQGGPLLYSHSQLVKRAVEMAHAEPELQTFLLDMCLEAIKSPQYRSASSMVIQSGFLTQRSNSALIHGMVESLPKDRAPDQMILKQLHRLISDENIQSLSTGQIKQLVHFLLVASEYEEKALTEENSSEKVSLSDLDSSLATIMHTSPATFIETIHESLLLTRGNVLISLQTLTKRMQQLVELGSTLTANIFPELRHWETCLNALVSTASIDGLGCSFALRGAFWLCQPEIVDASLPDDVKAITDALRMATFTCELWATAAKRQLLPLDNQVDYLYHLYLSSEVARDYMSQASGHTNSASSQRKGSKVTETVWLASHFYFKFLQYLPVFDMATDEALDTITFLQTIHPYASQYSQGSWTVSCPQASTSWCQVSKEDRHKITNTRWKPSDTDELYPMLIAKCMGQKSLSRSGFYNARVLKSALQRLTFRFGSDEFAGDAWLASLEIGLEGRGQRTNNRNSSFLLLAVIQGLSHDNRSVEDPSLLRQSPLVKKLLNELLSEISQVSVESNTDMEAAILILVTLNSCLDVYKSLEHKTAQDMDSTASGEFSAIESINHVDLSGIYNTTTQGNGPKVYHGHIPTSNPRLVIFAVKKILSWTSMPEFATQPLAAECCRALRRLLPAMKDVYGTYWDSTIALCISILSIEEADIPFEKTSSLWCGLPRRLWNGYFPPFLDAIQLVRELREFASANDDLVQALSSSDEDISQALISLLQFPRPDPTPTIDPMDAELRDALAVVDLSHIKDLSEMYHLVAVDHSLVRVVAFDLLQRALPSIQEQLSVDVILEKKDAQLPDELVSLLLEAPSYTAYDEEDHAKLAELAQGYLLAWQLVFDCFRNASQKIRNDYLENLKSGDYISPLLTFMFDFMGHSAANAVDLKKADLEKYLGRSFKTNDPDAEGMSPEQWTERLLVSIYFDCLRFAPMLAKTWVIDCKSKQTKLAVQAWTEKWFSSRVVSEIFADVEKWDEAQDPDVDEKPLLIKIYRQSQEIIAGYEVDESEIQISIRLPAAYPLDNVIVTGVNRVAVTEQKFKSWRTNTLGAITFSNGSIINGLEAFRTNVVGSLKGVAECAICYSVVAADKKLPDKRCGTCNNLFHGSCLFKWFQSSAQSTCPLCRTPFKYAK
ncbi:hypothetical protein BP6252_04190 [Coleophoma cylindrospora]|uniref:E3 ubiquitin-protein ligase listerin n=1 Tax=Coleophoma cylindrospora TaxID=1849047 RepID=A0A3D8RZS9_9HELO|nr:hypothetical protein BP6252_04190 [Coleophoma cylindrospora]